MPRRPQPVLTFIESDLLLTELWARHPRVALAAEFMLQCGLRIGEAVALEWGWLRDLDGPEPMVDIPAERSKTRWPRTLPIPIPLRLKIQSVRRLQKLHDPLTIPSTWPLIINRWGRPPSRRYVQKVIRFASLKVLGRPVRPHLFRHTFATNMLRFTDLRTVQQALGHRSINSTMVYTHPTVRDIRDAMNRLLIAQSAAGAGRTDATGQEQTKGENIDGGNRHDSENRAR